MEEKQNKDQGKLTCNRNILFSIVSLATNEISGVAGMSKKSNCFLTRFLQNKSFSGVKIKYDINGKIKIDVYIDVYSNINVPDICFKVQENIKNNILSMVEIKTTKINVHIIDVVISKEEEYEDAIENSGI
ncbi:MAG: Asp23/Gls24 family envelope stress response protein [Clostridia bacterium]|nr:Asp23/Gls24 family envelope stress response protein [Clostridia bacterium]MDD4685709.1 Asp23/Gls24 family envelope stress response protein [Clostridia bacterium]